MLGREIDIMEKEHAKLVHDALGIKYSHRFLDMGRNDAGGYVSHA